MDLGSVLGSIENVRNYDKRDIGNKIFKGILGVSKNFYSQYGIEDSYKFIKRV